MQKPVQKIVASFVLVVAAQGAASAGPPIEAYGERPDVIDVALSPDGAHVAFIANKGGAEFFAVAKVGGDLIGAVKGDFKARAVSFAGARHAIFLASDTTKKMGFLGEWEHSAAIAFNLETRKLKLLLKGTEGLYPAQSGLGKIVGLSNSSNDVFMPAYTDRPGAPPSYDLYKVDLDSGRGRVVAKGNQNTIDYVVDGEGNVLAREEFDDDGRRYRIEARSEEVYRAEKTPLPPLNLLAVSSDADALIVGTRRDGEQFDRLARLDFDGKMSPPLYAASNADVEGVLTDINRVAFGVKFSGMTPEYSLNDPALDKAVKAFQSLFPDASSHVRDWSTDLSKLLIYVEGGKETPAYYVFDIPAKSAVKVSLAYPRIPASEIGMTTPIEYKARDGRKIPSVITTPPGRKLGDKLPLIVMPHGGPEAYDSIGFDYMAQFFANRGYMVLQPNFRGSAGFGIEHLEAGYGEWGGKMQDDVTDGAQLLIRKGWADGDRVCIVGASYGGYAALAGGAFTPDLYKCVVALAPVSDLRAMLNEEKSDSATLAYWTMLIGDRKKERDKLDAISPVNAAEAFKAPVLLLHGTDDTVVPYSQSAKMEDALKRAGKDVKLVKLEGEDHWLSRSETRLQTLKALDAFVSLHIGQ